MPELRELLGRPPPSGPSFFTTMHISIFGLGYVGCTTGACLAELGHTVTGVEPNPAKVELINSGRSPIVEKGLEDLLAKQTAAGRFRATDDWTEAIRGCDIAMVSVGTPSKANGGLDLRFVRRVAEQIGDALRDVNRYVTVVMRSTMLPGTVEETVVPLLETHSGKRAGSDFGVAMNPEFLREGTSIEDFFQPPKTVIGQLDPASGEALAEIYRPLPGPKVRVPLRVAEMVKYVDNSFHALKVAFANEVGNIAKEFAIDSHAVMEVFCLDTKLNLSPYYLKPGFAFGGSCLPKDLRALTHEARTHDLDLPLLSSILESNRRQVARVAHRLLEYKGRSIGFLGLSFKVGTDDLRESPIVDLVEFALGKGFRIRIFDQHVSLARLMGANKEYIERQIPHISSLLETSLEDTVRASDVIVIANRDPSYRSALEGAQTGKTIIDLVRLFQPGPDFQGNYYGLCW